MITLVLALVGVGIGMVLVTMFRPKPIIRSIQRETVYVDIVRLEELHPQARLVADMNKMASGMLITKEFQTPAVDSQVGAQAAMPEGISAEVAGKVREAMSVQVLGEADKALTLWEKDRKKSLSVRLAWNRKNMMSRAQDAIWFNKNDIYNRAGDQLMDVERKYGFNMLNKRLVKKELEIASDIHGYKPPDIPLRLETVQEELNALGKQYIGEQQTIDAWMLGEIDRVRSETMADVNSSLSRERVRSTVAIQADVQKARARISSRLESVNSAKPKRLLVLPDVATDVIVRVRPVLVRKDVGKIDMSGLTKSTLDIQKRIRDDVRSVVMDEAKSMGVKVVFDRSQAVGAKDMTADFAQLINNNVW
jgi:hypothetical protein